MTKLAGRQIPSLDALHELFKLLGENGTALEERDRKLLIIWETRARERVLNKSPSPLAAPHRWKLPDERQSLTHRFQMTEENGGPLKAYLTFGMYADGKLGELFCSIAKEGSFVSGIMDALTCVISIGLQYGVPLDMFTQRFRYSKFQPAGIVQGAPEALKGHGFFSSILDYIAAVLELRFPSGLLHAPDAPHLLPKPLASTT